MKDLAHGLVPCLVLAACHGRELTQPEPDPEPTHRLEIISGDGQADTVARVLDAPLVVRLLDEAGQPIAGTEVSWRVVTGEGELQAGSETREDGTSEASYTLGTLAGAQSVAAHPSELGGPAVFFTLHATADSPASLARRGDQIRTGEINRPLDSGLEVRLGDRYGNPVAGATIAWSAGSGVALDPATSVTDRSGVARAAGTIGNQFGSHAVTATFPDDPALRVDFEVRAFVPVPVASQILMPQAMVSAHDSFIRDGIAFLAAWDEGLVIYDVGNGIRGGTPEAPVEISRMKTVPTTSRGLPSVHNAWWMWNPTNGERRYLFVGEEGIPNPPDFSEGDVHVVDVSDLAAPREVARYHRPDAGAHYFWLDEARQILFVAYYNGGVVALDVSGTLEGDLADREIARIAPGGPGRTFTYSVHGENGSLYASDMVSGVWQLRFDGSGFTVEAGGFNLPTDGQRLGSEMALGNGTLYSGTLSGFAGTPVLIWDISGTGAPLLVDSLSTGSLTGAILDVKTSPDRRLLMVSTAGLEAGLYFYSLADPRRPVLIGRHLVSQVESVDFHTANFAAINGRLYVLAAQDPPTFKYLMLDMTSIIERL